MIKEVKLLIAVSIMSLMVVACGDSKNEATASAEPSFSIDAKMDTLAYKMAYLAKWKDGEFVKSDSTLIKDNAFFFKGQVEIPNVQYILFDDSKEMIVVFIENSDISIKGANLERENVVISGSAINTQLDAFIKDVKVYEERLKMISEEYYAAKEAGDESLLAQVEAKYDDEESLKLAFIEGYVNDNLNSVIAPYLTLRYFMGKETAELEKLNNSFSDSIRNSEYITLIEETLAVVKGSAIGSAAPLFTQNDAGGNPMNLEDLKGSYVLIDFWASWCGPCRSENPNVVAAYEKYHHKGFEILGVSFDQDKDKWLAAIEKDELVWFQVSDLKGWSNAAGKLYGVKSIPHSVLLDKEGVIIAKDLRGEALHNKLAEIFGENS